MTAPTRTHATPDVAPPQRPEHAPREPADVLLDLHAAAGNHAVSALLAGGGGEPLDPAVRADMEVGFGQDLSGVRVHVGTAAATSADSLGASAYTVGPRIVFGAGQYRPGDVPGRALIAHELAHVVQQTRGGSAPAESAAAERSATAGATAVLAGAAPQAGPGAATGVARQPAASSPDLYELALRGNVAMVQGQVGQTPAAWPVDEGLRALWSGVDTGGAGAGSAAGSPALVEFVDTVVRYQLNVMGRPAATATGVVDAETAESLRSHPIGATGTSPQPAAAAPGGTALTQQPGSGPSWGATAARVVRLLSTGADIQGVMLAAIRGFFAEMGDQLTDEKQQARFTAALSELLVPGNFGSYFGGYLGGLVVGFVSPGTDLIGLGVFGEQLLALARRMEDSAIERLVAMATEPHGIGVGFIVHNARAMAQLAALVEDPQQLLQLLEGAGAAALTMADGAGRSVARSSIAYFTGKDEETGQPQEGIRSVLTSMTEEEHAGPVSLVSSKLTRLRKAFVTTPWAKIGYNIGYVVGAAVSNFLLFVSSEGIGNVVARVGAWLGRVAPFLANLGKAVGAIGGAITAIEVAIGALLGKALMPLKPILEPFAELLERLRGFLRRLLGIAEGRGAAAAVGKVSGGLTEEVAAKAATPKATVVEPHVPAAPTAADVPVIAALPKAAERVTPIELGKRYPRSQASRATAEALAPKRVGEQEVSGILGAKNHPPPVAGEVPVPIAAAEEQRLLSTGTGNASPTGTDPRAVKKALKPPRVTGTFGGSPRAVDPNVPLAVKGTGAKPKHTVVDQPKRPQPQAGGGESGTRISRSVGKPSSVKPSAVEPAQEYFRNLKLLDTPRATPLPRDRYGILEKFDKRLAEMARELRASQAGTSPDAFMRTNIATAKVRVDGKIEYLDASNIPGSLLGAGRGFDSEQLLAQQLLDMERSGKKVELLQLYSERVPCDTCMHLLDTKFPNANIFFTVPEKNNLGRLGRGEALQGAYGLGWRR